MAFNWEVAALDYQVSEDGLTDVVTTVHWRVSKEDDEGNVGSAYGSKGVPAPNPDSFIAYADLTPETCLNWLFNETAPMDGGESGAEWKADTEAAVDAQLAEMENPTHGTGVPW